MDEPDLLEKPLPYEKKFKRDMEKAGFEVRTFPLDSYRHTYAVECGMGHSRYEERLPDVQDVVRATALRLTWSGCGGATVVMPRPPEGA